MKSIGVIDASPDIVFEVLLNLDRHQKIWVGHVDG